MFTTILANRILDKAILLILGLYLCQLCDVQNIWENFLKTKQLKILTQPSHVN